MKHHLIATLCLAALAGLCLVTPAFAVVTIDYVTVGNAGNAADPLTGYGAVSAAYKIGTYEVTNAQYREFLNAKGASNAGGIYNAAMAIYGITQTGSSGSYSYNLTSGLENKPVVYVSWFDAARFTNWLGNGQGGGSTETGAYTLNGATSGIITVNPGAAVYIPSENEWYKAAYYNGANSTYSLYPNGQNSITTADANYSNIVNALTNVGSYSGDPSSYGTFDQGGNAWELNDNVFLSYRGARGGGWEAPGETFLSASYAATVLPTYEGNNMGFRVASVPEPSTWALLALGAAGIIPRIRRRRKSVS